MALEKRPPIVAVLGHVDHGKTSLLDCIRASQLQAEEAGGITQSIGAYQVKVNGSKITFIDTPGHEAFTTMRARGGQAADIVVLVVAANEGVQPQTIEAIHHAQAAQVPIIVALNKIDLESAQPERVKAELAKQNLLPVTQGGEVPVVETSATQGIGIRELLNTILATSQKLNLQADPHAHPTGVLLESFLDKKRGPVATVIVKNGTLRVGDIITADRTYARVRALNDWQGNQFQEAPPSTPALVLGFKEVPLPGSSFEYAESTAKAIQRLEELEEKESSPSLRSPVEIAQRIARQAKTKEITEIPLIIKANTQGALEAVQRSLETLQTEQVKLKILHQGIGPISESDILLAASTKSEISGKGIVLGFNVEAERSAQAVAQQERVIYRTYKVIYHLLEELKEVIAGEMDALTPKVLGQAQIKAIFELSNGTHIAGCKVIQGKIKKDHKLQLVREEKIIGEARVVSLRQGKKDVTTVEEGSECGIGMKPELEFRVGDIIQTITE